VRRTHLRHRRLRDRHRYAQDRAVRPVVIEAYHGRMPTDDGEKEGRGIFGVLGYLIAAVIALGGGAWLALHLSSKGAEVPVANASPSAAASMAAAAPTGPTVALATAMGVQVTGESASAPERNQETARKFFEDHKDALLDSL